MENTRIMIVEDEGLIAQRIKLSLTRMGCEVVAIASWGEEAIKMAVEIRPELIMMDIMIKGDIDGIEAAIQIRQRCDIPVIYLTAYGDAKTLERAKASEPVGYILKPINELQMQVAIEMGLHQHKTGQKLKASERALKEERALLASKVEERTRKLSLANAELSGASRLKDEFLANMSHELRTPLTVIMGIAEIFNEQIYGTLNENQLNQIQMIVKSSHQMLTLVNDILDISRIEAGKLKLAPQMIHVDDICQSVIKKIRPLADEKGITTTYTPAPHVTTLNADYSRLKQILVNLLENAVKFSSKKGQAGLEVKENSAKGHIRFTIHDEGIGISKENLARMFKPFEQVDSSLTRKHSGAGLGLALAYRLSEMQGGSLSVESKVGQGSRFSVRLPWKTPDNSEPASTAEISLNPEISRISTVQSIPAEILLAEDNEMTIALISDSLNASGHHVAVARNGAEAVRCVDEKRPDVIFMDIEMPVMNGLEAIRQIRHEENEKPNKNDYQKIPIIALTALIMPGDREKCLAAGATEYLPKPVNMEALRKIIKNCKVTVYAPL